MKIEDARFPSVGITLQALIAPVIAILLIFASVILVVLLSGTSTQDRNEITRSQMIAGSAMQAVFKDLEVKAVEYAESEAVTAMVAGGSGRDRAHQRFRPRARSGFGPSHVLLIGGDGTSLFGGEAVAPHTIRSLDVILGGARALGGAAETANRTFALVDGELHAIAARAVAAPEGTDSPVLLLIQPVDDALLQRLATDFLLRNLRFEPSEEIGDGSGAYVRGPDGEVLGILAWQPSRPGRELLTSIVAPIVIAALLSGLLLSSFLTTAIRTSRAIRLGTEALEESDRALEESEIKLKAILDGVADGIFSFDEEGIIVAANESAGRMFGYHLDELVGRPATILLHADDEADDSTGEMPEPSTELKADTGAADVQYREITGWRRDGSRIVVDAAISQITYESGSVAIAIMRDVTERRQAEETLNLLSTGMVLVSPDGTLLMANHSAARVLDAGDGLRVSGGRVTAANKRQAEQLRGLVERASSGSAGDIGAAVMTVNRGEFVRPLSIMVTPLQLTREHGESEVAVIFIRDLEVRQTVAPEILGELFGLTPAEARVVVELVKGKRLQEVADDIGVSLNTVRNQLKQIFSKTNTGRQSELISLVLSSAAFVSEQGTQFEAA